MSKPDWLIDAERKKNYPTAFERAPKCTQCIRPGIPCKEVRYRDKELVMLYECSLHPGTYYTKYSCICEDFKG